ncbi:peptidylprolyl isomerase [Myxococcota bacterium]|nr:peptidylprolyl isomerase [Myxococcota bacterium]MBU1535693.1 peptidylprolyl isomerase [Myxococcota bacterium]
MATLVLSGCQKKSDKSKESKQDKTTRGLINTGEAAVDKAIKSQKPVVIINTSLGTIEVELDAVKAPVTSRNFLRYVVRGHYTNTIFHRVMSNFMIQGGGFTTEKIEKGDLLEPIKNEAGNGLSNVRGTIAMARTPNPNSAKAQFFINVKNNDKLDRANSRDGFGYAVFGKVINGMDVVDKIRYVRVSNQGGPFANLPDTMVVIKGMKIK